MAYAEEERFRCISLHPSSGRLEDGEAGEQTVPHSIKYHLAFQEINLSRGTIYEDERKLKQFAGFFEDLYDSGGCSTMDPRRIDEPTQDQAMARENLSFPEEGSVFSV